MVVVRVIRAIRGAEFHQSMPSENTMHASRRAPAPGACIIGAMATSVLASLPLFAELAPEERGRLERQMTTREFPPHSVIVRQGGPGDAAFFVLSGLVAVRRKEPESGIEFHLSELGPGQMFGEMALFTRKARNATVIALEPTTCAVLEYEGLRRVIEEHPSVSLGLVAILADRLEVADRHVGIDFVNLARLKIDPRVLKLLPQALITQHHVVPIAFCNNRLTLAMTNPNNVVAFDDVRRVTKGVMIEPAVITEEDFRKFMAASRRGAAQTGAGARWPEGRPRRRRAGDSTCCSPISSASSSSPTTSTAEAESKQDLMTASEDAPIIRLANSVLGLAIKQGASDIHVEPMEHDVVVRFRMDGVLQVVQKLPRKVQLGLISRLKILEPPRHRGEAAAAGRPHQRRRSTASRSTSASPPCRASGARRSSCASSTSRTRAWASNA